MLSPIHVGSSQLNHYESDYHKAKSSSDGSELNLDEVDPPEVGVPRKLISSNQLRKIITLYYIPLDFICQVPYSDEHISTPSPLEVVFV